MHACWPPGRSGTETPSRTSQGTFFTGEAAKHPLIESVEQRIDWLINHPALIAGKARLARTEALQVSIILWEANHGWRACVRLIALG